MACGSMSDKLGEDYMFTLAVMQTENRSDRTKCPEPLKSIGHNVLTPQKPMGHSTMKHAH